LAIRFDNISPQAFETLVQALSARVLGRGLSVFGAGPDGAREAAIDGEVAYPTDAEHWNGYIVVQAKCRESPLHTARDATWLIARLKEDLDKFLGARGLRAPQYYILCTNITLSPEAQHGGRVRVERVLAEYSTKLQLKGWSIWAADELRTFLEDATDIRTRYAAWVTPSDILASILKSLDRRNLTRLLPLALARDIREERDARLHDASQDPHRGIQLDTIFVDLPVVTDKETSRSDDERVVACLMRRCAEKFDTDTGASREARPARPLRNRIVIFGGPGQGKSTLAQFLAQIARARLLDLNRENLNPQAADVIDPVLARAKKEKISVVGPTRFPVRIDLPIFADALQNAVDVGGSLTLIDHIASRLSNKLGTPALTSDDVRCWLGVSPSVIILDGLDEVPSSGNRKSVIAEIDALWDELHATASDAVVIATTRPQGYARDLDPRYWEHWDLADLSRSDTLGYARQLADARIANSVEHVRVMQELTRATTDQATASLMISPLQVTILFGIALGGGKIPTDRWELFDRYYTVLRDREIQKPGENGETILRFKKQVDTLHRHAGFILQLAAESSGSATPFLTADEFRALATATLLKDGYDSDAVIEGSTHLVRIATERLVLLRARTQGQIAFDVRSLQEFMAAAEITSKPEFIIKRLRAIALSAHWRHVFRIAASKVFSVGDFEDFQGEVVSICHSIDNGDLGDDARLSRAGAKLALDLISDGVSAAVPFYHMLLFRRALAILDLPPSLLDSRLIHSLTPVTLPIFREETHTRIQQQNTFAAHAAWVAVFRASAVTDEFETLIVSNWPVRDVDLAVSIIRDLDMPPLSPSVVRLLRESQWNAGPVAVLDIIASLGRRRALDGDRITNWRSAIVIPLELGLTPLELRHLGELAIPISWHEPFLLTRVVPLDAFDSIPSATMPCDVIPALESRWAGLTQVIEFMGGHRTAVTLASALRGTAAADLGGRRFGSVPWMLDSLIADAEGGVSLEHLADEALSGLFGDLSDWQAAEVRWKRRGIFPGDFTLWSTGRYISRSIATVGAPCPRALSTQSVTTQPPPSDEVEPLLSVVRTMKMPDKAARLLGAILFGLQNRHTPAMDKQIISLIPQLIAALQGAPLQQLLFNVAQYFEPSWEMDEFLQAADLLGRAPRLFAPLADVHVMVRAFNTRVELRGLLPIIVHGFAKYTLGSYEYGAALHRLDPSAFLPRDDDEPQVRASVAALAILDGVWRANDIPRLVSELCIDGANVDIELIRAITIDAKVLAHQCSDGLLRALATYLFEVGSTAVVPLVERLATQCSASRSGFDDARFRANLKLPSMPTTVP
jgi:hypothetical protein